MIDFKKPIHVGRRGGEDVKTIACRLPPQGRAMSSPSCFRSNLKRLFALPAQGLKSQGGFSSRYLTTAKSSLLDDHDADDLNLPDPSNPAENPLASLSVQELTPKQKYWRERAKSTPPIVRQRVVDELGRSHAVGKRKTSVALVWLRAGEGRITVNKRNFVEVFCRADHRDQIIRPFSVTDTLGKFSVESFVKGGGETGKAEALRHGIAKALQLFDPSFRPPLKADGLLTRDSRTVESKKYGRRKARRSFQWVKR